MRRTGARCRQRSIGSVQRTPYLRRSGFTISSSHVPTRTPPTLPAISIRIRSRWSTGARLEPALAATKPGEAVQFERQGYFCLDADTTPDKLVFNRTVGLRDTWAKVQGGKTP